MYALWELIQIKFCLKYIIKQVLVVKKNIAGTITLACKIKDVKSCLRITIDSLRNSLRYFLYFERQFHIILFFFFKINFYCFCLCAILCTNFMCKFYVQILCATFMCNFCLTEIYHKLLKA